MNDIVYILRNGIDPYELIYSLRSLENFPHGNVWFFGGDPKVVSADYNITFEQRGVESWQKVRNSLEIVTQTRNVSDDFWLFNDDFFVMKKVDGLRPWYHGTLQTRVDEIVERHDGMTSLYSTRLLFTKEALEANGCKTFNYAVHVPMLLNKYKLREVIKRFPKTPMIRSVYGNYWRIGGMNRPDVKISDKTTEPDRKAKFLSTSDSAFRDGLVGAYIREQFPTPSRFEK
jgi:hypothetical protein